MPVVLERPKMSRPMWDALKCHIMRERQRKKQELEADAEMDRQRKERERQQKQHVLTLSETREQITQSEARLAELKEEKHQLFLQLKKVLNEDEIRKRQLYTQEAQEMMRFQFNYPNNPPRIQLMPPEQQQQPPPHHHPSQQQQQAQTYLQPIQLTRAPVSITQPQAQVFKVGHPQQQQQQQPPGPGGGGVSHHNTSPHAQMPITIKRSRSPSPPPHPYKFGPFKPPPQAIPQYAHQTLPTQTRLFHPEPNIYFHPPSQISQQQPNSNNQPPPSQQQQQQQQHSQHGPVSFSSVPHPSAGPPPQSTLYTYSSAPPSRSPQQPSRDESQQQQQQQQRHVPGPMFIHHGAPVPRGYVLHQAVEQHSRSSPHNKFPEDGPKYYPPPTHGLALRAPPSHLIHPGLTIQPNQNVPSGSITSGFPIRTQPNVSTYQGRPPSPQVAGSYSVPGGPSRHTYGHPHGQIPQHPIQRYSLPPGVQRD
ncbi:extensin isoform X3 [Folsomia candida]|uniref:extensin isoform X3 n=1 Tax=Folsomia candida TaxID=158441 RepID=UPI000B8F282E|nr:extensin isoform X3 [Folsomia candida]